MVAWLAIDIGGANLKAADGHGYAASTSFALYREPQRLAHELRMMIAEAPRSDHLAVTMSGELADCFESKTDGVKHIVQSVSEAADGRHARIYTLDGKLVTPQVALRDPLNVAAANWHALSRYAVRFAPTDAAILLDVGSTTCDVVPFVEGDLAARASTDTGRLLAGELVYTGADRTPLCSVAHHAPYRGQQCPLAREFFATARDIYLILGDLPEEPANTHTADGRGSTKADARRRLGRMICADDDQFNHRDAVAMAHAMSESQVRSIVTSVEQVVSGLPAQPTRAILSGQGEFIGRRVLEQMGWTGEIVSLNAKLGPVVSRCAPAHALAVLAIEATR